MEYNLLLLLGLTALATSFLTLFTGYLLVRRVLAKHLDSYREELLAQFRRELSAAFESSAEDLLPTFRKHVEEGMIAGAQQVLPQFREEVREGFKKGLGDTLGTEWVDSAVSKAAKSGARMMDLSLDFLFGKSKDQK